MSNRKYTKEFKLDAVRLAISSEKSQAQVARDLGLKENCLYTWISKYRGDILEGTHITKALLMISVDASPFDAC